MPRLVAAEIEASGGAPLLLKSLENGVEMAHIFVTRRGDLVRLLGELRMVLAAEGMIWVSWPKKSSRMATELSDETIRQSAFPLGLVDVKVCAVNETWSGLKLVIRKIERQSNQA